MSAPPFFQSAGRGDLLFWGTKEGPTVVIWESLSEQEKASWLEEASTTHDRARRCQGGGDVFDEMGRVVQVKKRGREQALI